MVGGLGFRLGDLMFRDIRFRISAWGFCVYIRLLRFQILDPATFGTSYCKHELVPVGSTLAPNSSTQRRIR